MANKSVVIKRLGSCSVSKSCPILCNPMDCSPPGSSVHGILQARILEWVAISFSICIYYSEGKSTKLDVYFRKI